MKVLESTPERYDAGIRMLTLGKLDQVYDRLASYIKSDQRVLDIGCGTGALTLRAALKGANVKGIDEMGVAELDGEKSENYDIVMSGLCFSELTENELIYTLKEIKRILKPMGILLVADEARPNRISKRIFNWFVRFPLIIITYILTQTTIRAIENLPAIIEGSGFLVESVRLNKMGNFIELIGKKPRV
jgi:ubiquinone/menaquinone biosynthesis C-methylase UbiE